MTQEPEKKPNSSPEKRFAQRSLQAVARWSPLGGAGFAFGSFLLKQEWATALALFPVTAISGVWAAYSKSFIERLSEVFADKRLNLSSSEKKALENLKETVKTSRYQKLEEYLKTKEWFQADQETYHLILTTIGRDEGQWFGSNDLKNFPYDELLAIDRLWVEYSNGLYGFSVQKQIYVGCGGKLDLLGYPKFDWDQFCDSTAWKSEGEWVGYPKPFFEPFYMNHSGHLPCGWGSWFGWMRGSEGCWELRFLFSHPDL